MKKPASGKKLLIGVGVACLSLLIIASSNEIRYQWMLMWIRHGATPKPDVNKPTDSASVQLLPNLSQWKGEHAMRYIATQLSFGARALDTPGHQKEIDFIVKELSKDGITTQKEEWTYNAADGSTHSLTNIIARFDPSNPRRVIIGTHYDSIIRAYRDKKTPDAVMPGANNSASGVALLLETAAVLAKSQMHPSVGVDFIFFDGEEGPLSMGEGDKHWEALGSPYFASHLEKWYAPQHMPEKSIIFDMVCFKDMKLYPERLSTDTAGDEVKKFWDIGSGIAPDVFKLQQPMRISDDQEALAKKGIPSILVIGFQYEPWFNTTEDTIDKCSTGSLEAVGHTLVQYLFQPS